MSKEENEDVEKRVKSLLAHFRSESAILDQIVYKMKNQHRRAFYFRYLLKVRRDVNLLKSANLEGILNFLFHVIKEKKLDTRAKKRKVNNESRQFHLRLLGGARLLSQMVEPMVKAAIEFSTLLARSFFQSFSLAMLALLARLRVLVQQILLDVVLVFNMFSTIHGAQSTVLNFGGVEVVREYFPSDNDVISLDCIWETDKFVLHEKINKCETTPQVQCAGNGVDAPLIPSSIKYQTIEAFLGDDDGGYQKKDADLSGGSKDRSDASVDSFNEEMEIEDNDDKEGREKSPEKLAEGVIYSSQENIRPESRSKVAFVSVAPPAQMNRSAPSKSDVSDNSPAKTASDSFFNLLTAGNVKDSLF